MTKRLTHALTYDAPAAAVAAMLSDPAFREQVCDAQHVLRHSVTIEGAAASGDLRVSIDQVRTAGGVPTFAKKFVGDEINIVHTESWSSPESGELRMSIPGKPGEMSGTVRLAESGGTTTQSVTLDIRVGIPLLGGKIEGLIADLLEKAYQVENRVGRDYLSR